uniref:E3 ubiquitin-protein ligase n=1 Tax=Globodera pallida TaxID=36090 RepID=A0A183BPQ0_GLOPA
MSSLVDQFERRQCVVAGARCHVRCDGSLREWLLFCTPKEDGNECATPAIHLVMEVCHVSTALIYALAERNLFHPQIIEFVVEESDHFGTSNKRIRNFSVAPSESVELELYFRVELRLLEPFFLHWLVVDHWQRLVGILCGACPRLERLTLAFSFVLPTLRHMSAPLSDWTVPFADVVAYGAELMQRFVLTPLAGASRLQWLWVQMIVGGLCDAEFTKFGVLRREHPLFMPETGPIGWNYQNHVVIDRVGREHWLTIEIVDPSLYSTAEPTKSNMDEEEWGDDDDGRADEETDDDDNEENSLTDDEGWMDGYYDDDDNEDGEQSGGTFSGSGRNS